MTQTDQLCCSSCHRHHAYRPSCSPVDSTHHKDFFITYNTGKKTVFKILTAGMQTKNKRKRIVICGLQTVQND